VTCETLVNRQQHSAKIIVNHLLD